jgi:hypothetical protein
VKTGRISRSRDGRLYGDTQIKWPPTCFTSKLNWQIWLAKEPWVLIVGNISRMQQVRPLITEEQSGKTPYMDTEIDLLVRKTRMPREVVAKLYTSVRAKLERTARIKTYVNLLIHRQVKDLLREQHRT